MEEILKHLSLSYRQYNKRKQQQQKISNERENFKRK